MLETGEFYKDLGARLAKARKDASLTQAQLAGRLGLARSAIANIEAGRQNLYVHSLLEFCKALDIAPLKVFEGIDDNKQRIVFPNHTDKAEQELILRTLSRE